MTVLATLLGVGLIFFALREVFQQLFIPNGGGSLSRVLMRAVWRVSPVSHTESANSTPHRPVSLRVCRESRK